MNLAENESDWLARHLGHDIRVHREFYRLHESTVELAKISKILIASEKGETHKLKGLSLEEIPDDQVALGNVETESDSSESFSEESEESDNSDESEMFAKEMKKGKTSKNPKSAQLSSNEVVESLKRKLASDPLDHQEPSTSKALRRSTDEQDLRSSLFEYFKEDIKQHKVPSKSALVEFISHSGTSLPWLKIKEIMNARIQKEKRKSQN